MMADEMTEAEVNRIIAEKVMGWKPEALTEHGHYDGNTKELTVEVTEWSQPPDYLRRPDLVGPVLDAITGMGHSATFCFWLPGMLKRVRVSGIADEDGEPKDYEERAETSTVALMHAIARAEKEQQ